MGTPIAIEVRHVSIATKMDALAPYIILLKTSRPILSVPNGYFLDGEINRTNICSGSYGANTSANKATSIIVKKIMNP